MLFRNTSTKYGVLTKFFHWTTAIIVFAQFYFIIAKKYFITQKELKIYYVKSLHKPIGFILLFLVTGFIIWSICNIKPKLPNSIPRWQKFLSNIIHKLLYLCIFLMPLSGVLMSSYSGYGIDLFGLTQISLGLEKSKSLANFWHEIHEYVSLLLFFLIIIHIVAALKHHFINKNNILTRMLP